MSTGQQDERGCLNKKGVCGGDVFSQPVLSASLGCVVSHADPPPFLPRDEVQLKTAYSKSNGQPKSIGSAAPGPGQPPLSSPTRGGVKKVSGVGGTTYEISV